MNSSLIRTNISMYVMVSWMKRYVLFLFLVREESFAKTNIVLSQWSLDYRRCSHVFIFMRCTSVNGKFEKRTRTRRRRRRKNATGDKRTNRSNGSSRVPLCVCMRACTFVVAARSSVILIVCTA